MSNLTQEILEIVREMPKATTKEIEQLMSHASATRVRRLLLQMSNTGRLIRHKVKTNRSGRAPSAYELNPDWNGNAVKLVQPDLTAELRELRQWKAEALLRYPDLAVDPNMLRARTIVAAQAGDDHRARDEILGGKRDTSLAVRSTFIALTELAA